MSKHSERKAKRYLSSEETDRLLNNNKKFIHQGMRNEYNISDPTFHTVALNEDREKRKGIEQLYFSSTASSDELAHADTASPEEWRKARKSIKQDVEDYLIELKQFNRVKAIKQ